MSADPVPQLLAGQLPETSYYQTVVDAGRVLGWRVTHFRGNLRGQVMGDPGFVDFVLVHPRGHVLFVELKSDRKGAKLTPDQEAWRDDLVAAGARWLLVWVPVARNHQPGLGLDDLLSLMHDLAIGT